MRLSSQLLLEAYSMFPLQTKTTPHTFMQIAYFLDFFNCRRWEVEFPSLALYLPSSLVQLKLWHQFALLPQAHV